jgi:hypothetical protein
VKTLNTTRKSNWGAVRENMTPKRLANEVGSFIQVSAILACFGLTWFCANYTALRAASRNNFPI